MYVTYHLKSHGVPSLCTTSRNHLLSIKISYLEDCTNAKQQCIAHNFITFALCSDLLAQEEEEERKEEGEVEVE